MTKRSTKKPAGKAVKKTKPLRAANPVKKPSVVKVPTAKPKPKKKAEPLPAIETTQKAAAKRLGITDRQLRNWIAEEPDFPDCTLGYDIEAIQEWQEFQGRKGSTASEEAAAIHLQTQETRLERWRIAKAKEAIELEELRGRLMPRQVIKDLLAELASLIRETLRELQRQSQHRAFEMIEEMLVKYERTVDQRLATAEPQSDQ